MSSAFACGEQRVWGSNGAIASILIRLIRYSPDGSPLLAWAVENYRSGLGGGVYALDELLPDPAVQAHWREAISQALDAIRAEEGWTDYGLQWLDENRQALIDLAGP